jgi:hypothetical protein
MFNLKTRLKKMLAIGVSALALSILVIAPAKSEDLSTVFLAMIAQYTYNTADAAYHIEEYTYGLLVFLNSWIMPDKSETSANLQSGFANATSTAITNYATQTSLQNQLMADFFGPSVTSETVDYANDMAFGTLIGQPYYSTDPRKKKKPEINPAYNYLKNVAGLNITHAAPNASWSGSDDDKKKYTDFYTTVSSIQSFNAYVLSQLYADNADSGTLTQQQNQLIQQASGSDWFAQVASENIGIVLRQMLMYNSQIFTLLTQLLQTQKQMVAELAMTNTLIVIGDQFSENQLIQKATISE